MGRRLDAATGPGRPGILLTALLVYTALSVYEPAWRLLLRGLFEGDAFEWNLGPLGGTGTGGDYPVIVATVLYGTTLLVLGWRGVHRPFRWMLVAWALFLVSQSASLTIAANGTYVGETLGIELPLGPLLLVLDLTYLAGSVAFFLGRGRVERQPERAWGARNWAFLAAFAAAFPVIYVLLRSGPQHGPTDQVGVVGTLVQWALLNLALYPWVRDWPRPGTADAGTAAMEPRSTVER